MPSANIVGRLFWIIFYLPGRLGLPAAAVRAALQQPVVWDPGRQGAQEVLPRLRATPEGQAGPISRQLVRKTSRLFEPNSHLAGSQSSNRTGDHLVVP